MSSFLFYDVKLQKNMQNYIFSPFLFYNYFIYIYLENRNVQFYLQNSCNRLYYWCLSKQASLIEFSF